MDTERRTWVQRYRYEVTTENGTKFTGQQCDTYIGTEYKVADGVLIITGLAGKRFIVNWNRVVRMTIELLDEDEQGAQP